MSVASGPPLVVDAATTIAWMLADEQDPYALRAAEYVEENGALVPALWRWEVQNILLMAMRRGRISEAQMTEARMLLVRLPIEVDPPTLFGAELALARAHNLTAYDAAYLELAIRSDCKLATNDADLAEAARAAGVRWKAGA